MSDSGEKWIDGLRLSSLYWPPPADERQRQAQVMAYAEYFGERISEQFPEDVSQIIQSHYPSKGKCLLDDVLAIFVLHHPDHGHAVVHPILSCIIAGTLVYDKNDPPFCSFISLVSQKTEKEYSEQWALACGEILRVLTHYNRPVYQVENHVRATNKTSTSSPATTCGTSKEEASHLFLAEVDRKPLRPLSPWITDILLAAPLAIRSDYFRWCGGVMGKYSAGGELKPPTAASSSSRGSGKHPQLTPSTPRWAVANGAGVILSVCDDEVARYETVNLTAAAVPALLLPPPIPLEEHLVTGLPALEPYARLFHRYYAIATPNATQRLLLGLLEAPPSWAPDALDAAVQLVDLLRAAEDYASGMRTCRLPRNWMHLHFLRAIGAAMSTRVGMTADAACALLFRILSQPALLFPPFRHAEGVEVQHEPMSGYISSYKKQLEAPVAEANVEATAQGLASMLCAHGPEVEWRICTIWEAAYGLLPLSSSIVDLPEVVVACPLQPPALSWSLYLPLLKVLEYLPRGSPSEACLMRIFVATVEATLRRTFPPEASNEQSKRSGSAGGMSSTTKNIAVAELRTMINSLFLESGVSVDLASRLLFVLLTVCVSHEALLYGSKRPAGTKNPSDEVVGELQAIDGKKDAKSKIRSKQGPVATFDSYVLAAICALTCELQLFPLISKNGALSDRSSSPKIAKIAKSIGVIHELRNGLGPATSHTRRILGILEAVLSLKPSSVGTSWTYGSNEILAAAMVAAHVSELFGRSKACKNALAVLMRCKWDTEIASRASSLYHLLDIHGKTVASIVDKAEPLQANLVCAHPRKDSIPMFFSSTKQSDSSTSNVDTNVISSLWSHDSTRLSSVGGKIVLANNAAINLSWKLVATFPMDDASNLANFLTTDNNTGHNYCAQALLRSLFDEKPELCFSVVSVLWHKLIAAPETGVTAEGTSAQQGWRQVMDALCDVVSASPSKASTAIVVQAERDLHPWVARDNDQDQKLWTTNQRIVKLIVELLRNHDNFEALIILASTPDLLLRATDGMLVDGEACTLPQLELLEVTASVVQLVVNWGEAGLAFADGLSELLKCRLSATVRCLSHSSALVRTLSTSVLRGLMDSCPIMSSSSINREKHGIHSTHYRCFGASAVNWHADIKECIKREAHSRHATGLTHFLLDVAAKELGCPLPC